MGLRLPKTHFLLFCLALSACGSKPRVPDMNRLYDRIAQSHTGERNPVVVLPGLLGSNLVDRTNGQIVWGAFDGNYANPRKAEGRRAIALPMAEGVPLRELRTRSKRRGRSRACACGSSACRSASTRTCTSSSRSEPSVAISTRISVESTTARTTTPVSSSPTTGAATCPENAVLLHEFWEEQARYVAEEEARRGFPERDVRFDVVAHSLGGLVLRYYLRHGPVPLADDGSLPPSRGRGPSASNGPFSSERPVPDR